MDTSMSTKMQSAMIAPPKGMFGAKTKKAALKTKKWTMASDDKSDKAHGIKESSPTDIKLDAKRGIKDIGLASSLAKLGGK